MNIRKTGNNLTAKIVSVTFAVILWFHVTTNATFNYKVSLPIQYVGPSEGFIVASVKPDEMVVNIKGTGKKLFTFYLFGFVRSHQRYALVNLTGLNAGKNQISIDKSAINLGILTGLQVESILYPDNATFTIEIDREIKRTVAVNSDSLPEYRVDRGYCVAGKPFVKPEFVLIKGPENVINSINSLRVSHLVKKTVSQRDTVLKAHLEIPQFVSVDSDEVEIYFPVELFITRSLKGVPLTLEGFPGRNHPDFKPDSLSVDVQGPESLVSHIEPDNILIAIEYQKYLEHMARGDSLITPTVTFPAGITVTNIYPRVIQFPVPSTKG